VNTAPPERAAFFMRCFGVREGACDFRKKQDSSPLSPKDCCLRPARSPRERTALLSSSSRGRNAVVKNTKTAPQGKPK
jgi:hypothetical protein